MAGREARARREAIVGGEAIEGGEAMAGVEARAGKAFAGGEAGAGEAMVGRVSKSCNHATMRLRKNFQVLRKIWVFEPENT